MSKLLSVLFLLFFKVIIAQVGINTTVPLSTLDINGNLTVKEIGIANANIPGSGTFLGGTTSSPSLINDGIYISLTPSGANNSFSLPNAVNFPGRTYILRNISGSEDVLLYTTSGNLFFSKNSKDPTASPIVMPFNGDLKTLILISDGINWTYIF
ncbi:conserved hypothetical protein [Flavobacterium sp. 9AF]|uniref:hypothetical protein n=1 Tax=Flavobacterium sp. 9AF TaxID=2653142 RepID=UPI0012F3B6D8|nr:hypothetical protein [Flavobacterium sp. 9AF]VXB78759.1 conserved hypothetical protein [Flavobacterium sp. 9AF]